MNIPFLDLVTIHKKLKPQLTEVFEKCVNSGGFVGGPMVQDFEERFAAFTGTKFSVGLNSGTDALRLALLALNIQPGDRVVTVSNTFIATTEAITQAGGVIEFVDVEEATSLMDVTKLEELLKARKRDSDSRKMPKFVIPVHLYGQMVNMTEVMRLSREYGFKVVEDCAQAHGATHFGKPAGTWGDIGAFSFYPGKNLGALGEGGAITTNDQGLATKVKVLREHGQKTKYYHITEGYNARLDSMQAGFLSVKLGSLAEWNEQRRTAAKHYDQGFANEAAIKPVRLADGNLGVYHLYVIHVEQRDRLFDALKEKGVNCGYHYPMPLHLQDCYKSLNVAKGSLPVTERLALRLISLPMFPGLTAEQLDYVVKETKSAVGKLV